MRVLIVVASQNGAMREIADSIAHVLNEHGLTAAVSDLADVDEVEPYEAVILGSGIHDGRWMTPAQLFVDVHSGELLRRPTWLFSLDLDDPVSLVDGHDLDVDSILQATGALQHRLFTPRRDTKERDPSQCNATLSGQTRSEARGWADARAWATDIAIALERGPIATMRRTDRTRLSERWTRRSTHARGRRFWALLIGIWPLAVLIGVTGGLTVGGGLAVWITSALVLALGVVVLVPQVLFEIDDGDPPA